MRHGKLLSVSYTRRGWNYTRVTSAVVPCPTVPSDASMKGPSLSGLEAHGLELQGLYRSVADQGRSQLGHADVHHEWHVAVVNLLHEP